MIVGYLYPYWKTPLLVRFPGFDNLILRDFHVSKVSCKITCFVHIRLVLWSHLKLNCSCRAERSSYVHLPTTDDFHPNPEVIIRLSKQLLFHPHFHLTIRQQCFVTNSTS